MTQLLQDAIDHLSTLSSSLPAEEQDIVARKVLHQIGQINHSKPFGKNRWQHVADEALRVSPLKGKSAEFLQFCRSFRNGFTFERPTPVLPDQ